MPSPGVSLVGFMNQPQAFKYFQTDCIPANPADTALAAEWETARKALGSPMPNPGSPEMRQIPTGHENDLLDIRSTPEFPMWFRGESDFRLIELDPLLVFQFHVDVARSKYLCNQLTSP